MFFIMEAGSYGDKEVSCFTLKTISREEIQVLGKACKYQFLIEEAFSHSRLSPSPPFLTLSFSLDFLSTIFLRFSSCIYPITD